MTAAAKVLDRLTQPKQSGQGRWVARCPAHEDRSPSLSIRATDDGRVLIHCFAGCTVADVLAAIGLGFADLFDKPLAHHLPPIRGGFSARELLTLNAHEATVAALLVAKATAGPLSTDDAARLVLASDRLIKAGALLDA